MRPVAPRGASKLTLNFMSRKRSLMSYARYMELLCKATWTEEEREEFVMSKLDRADFERQLAKQGVKGK